MKIMPKEPTQEMLSAITMSKWQLAKEIYQAMYEAHSNDELTPMTVRDIDSMLRRSDIDDTNDLVEAVEYWHGIRS